MCLSISIMKKAYISIMLFLLMVCVPSESSEYNDKIIAIVNDRVILKSEVQDMIDNLSPEIIAKEYSTLNDKEIITKVLGNLIETSLLVQAADRFGIQISDIALENELQRLASSKKLSVEDFRKKLIDQGQNYSKFLNNLRDRMTIETLFVSQFYSRMNVTEEEVENFIERENVNQYGNIQYDLIEFVIKDEEKELNQENLNQVYKSILNDGFNNTKINYDNLDIEINNIGVISQEKLPDIFLDALTEPLNEKYTKLIKSSRGYHILHVIDSINKTSSVITEYKVRHILLIPDVMTTDEDIKNKLFKLKNEITNIDDFILNAKKYSDDKASGFKGGDLGYQRSTALVKEFADVMKKTPLKKISEPFQSRFGWHILYVENIRSVDDTKSNIRKNIAKIIRADKAKVERDDWVAKLKDQAYIEIKEF